MKFPSVLTLTCLLVIICVLTFVDGGRKRGRRMRKLKQCVYRRKGEKGPCNQDTGNMDVIYRLKASRQRFDCPATKIRTRKCPGCKYPKNSVPFGECVDGHMSKVAPLGKGSMPGCPATRVVSRKCRRGGGKGRRKGRKGCVYTNKDWSECNMATNTRQRERILVAGDSTSCLPKKVVTKKCRKACRYIKQEWSECDNATNTKNRTLDPKPGSLAQCESNIQTKSCFAGADNRGKRLTKCRYKFGGWSQCDSRTNTMTRQMTLRKGDPNLCKRTVKLSRKCRPTCKFRKGNWSDCDRLTRLMTRVDRLVKGNPKHCEKKREIIKKCRKSNCKYSTSAWSECSSDDNSRRRMKKLISGKADQCKPEIPIVKPCVGKNGQDRCFFGSWGEFGPCTNGVMTKQRVLLQGGMECERRAVVAKACGDD